MAISYYKGKVTGGNLKLRATPNGTQVAIIPTNTVLVVQSTGSGWAHRRKVMSWNLIYPIRVMPNTGNTFLD